MSLGSIFALIAAHRAFVNVDSEEIATLESRLREGRKVAKPEVNYDDLWSYDTNILRNATLILLL